MTGWSAPFAKRVLDSWATHSKQVGAQAVADRIRLNIKASKGAGKGVTIKGYGLYPSEGAGKGVTIKGYGLYSSKGAGKGVTIKGLATRPRPKRSK